MEYDIHNRNCYWISVVFDWSLNFFFDNVFLVNSIINFLNVRKKPRLVSVAFSLSLSVPFCSAYICILSVWNPVGRTHSSSSFPGGPYLQKLGALSVYSLSAQNQRSSENTNKTCRWNVGKISKSDGQHSRKTVIRFPLYNSTFYTSCRRDFLFVTLNDY